MKRIDTELGQPASVLFAPLAKSDQLRIIAHLVFLLWCQLRGCPLVPSQAHARHSRNRFVLWRAANVDRAEVSLDEIGKVKLSVLTKH
jgi:hypothetical protein